jgi:cysteine dioxygenase
MCGTCTETVFGHAPCGQVVARFSKDIAAGSVTASQDSDTHQVSNLQEARDNLVTIHVYSPPLRAMKTFSIIGESDQESKPAVTHGF